MHGHKASRLRRSGRVSRFSMGLALELTDGSKMTDVYEGSLVRLFRRLEELLRQMGEASKVMGSDELAKKFEDALSKIRRDLVAAQSLYLG